MTRNMQLAYADKRLVCTARPYHCNTIAYY